MHPPSEVVPTERTPSHGIGTQPSGHIFGDEQLDERPLASSSNGFTVAPGTHSIPQPYLAQWPTCLLL